MFKAIHPLFGGVHWAGCINVLNMLLMQTSPRWHWHQKAMFSIAKTVALKVSFRFKPALKALRWASVTGAHFSHDEEGGAADAEPHMALLKWEVPCHGAAFTMYQSFFFCFFCPREENPFRSWALASVEVEAIFHLGVAPPIH